MKEIIFATGNMGKRATAKKFFNDYNINLLCKNFDATELYVEDLELIAESKVRQAYDHFKSPCITVDAGFYVSSYPDKPNFPGALVKREMLSKIGIEGLLEKMENVEDRKCFTKECLAYYDGKILKIFWGINHGTLAKRLLGNYNDELWSDIWRVFIPNNCSKTLAQMTSQERNVRPDGHTDCFAEFLSWYTKKY